MASDYPSRIVLLGFFVQNQTAGTPEQRETFSNDLFTRFDGHIVTACASGGLTDPSADARAIMAVMALNAPGASPKTRAGNAVKAYLAYRGF
ncbi:MAG: hypothetical protein OEW19_07660 [Acidobacteriota bacterium]|nr:hypothetical protein [Acidobacteriota bacterium]